MKIILVVRKLAPSSLRAKGVLHRMARRGAAKFAVFMVYSE